MRRPSSSLTWGSIPPTTARLSAWSSRSSLRSAARNCARWFARRQEESKVAIRSIRRDANDQLKKQEKAGELTEDDLKKYEAEIQKATDSFIKDIDKIAADKEKEIMEV